MKHSKLNIEKKLYPARLMIPAALVFGFFYIVPVVASFVMSMTDWNINRFYQPEWIAFENFRYIFQDPKFLLSAKNTLIFAVASSVLKTLLGLILALALNRKLKTKNLMRTVYYLPAVLSMVIVGIMMKSIFSVDGVFNQLLGSLGLEFLQKDWIMNKDTAMGIVIFADVWRWTGFNMAMFLAGLQGIDQTYYEAAKVDGASGWKMLKNITLPLLMPSFTINIVFNVIGGLKVFDQVFIITGGGPGYATQVLSTYVFNNYSQGLLGRSTAMSLILFIVVYVTATLVNNYLKKKEIDI